MFWAATYYYIRTETMIKKVSKKPKVIKDLVETRQAIEEWALYGSNII